MNMKKTIAAVAAATVAVSAMATSVSALEDKTLTYNLVAWDIPWDAQATVTLQATITGATVPTFNGTDGAPDSGTFRIEFPDTLGITVESVRLKITDDNIAEQNRSYVYAVSTSSLNYSSKLSDAGLDLDHELDFLSATTGTPSATIVVEVTGKTSAGTSTINEALRDGKFAIVPSAADATNGIPASAGAATATTLTAYADGDTTKYQTPFRTGAQNNENIINYLQTNGLVGDWWAAKAYTNVIPVLNDAVENYESVVFTFTTATSGIKWLDVNTKNTYNNLEEAIVKAGGTGNVKAIYSTDSDADTSYTTFTQHLYNYTGSPYGAGSSTWGGFVVEDYTGFDFGSQNLFGGALVVNENLTMSLNDVDYFDWTATTLSFDWDAILDNAATSNNYARFIQSLKLATSTEWYWDKMDVVLVAGAADDASANEGIEGQEEELDDGDDLGEELVDDGEIPAVDDETPAVDNTADVPAVSSPKTGNAPVALAVIPVALAAAAIVAKKRG